MDSQVPSFDSFPSELPPPPSFDSFPEEKASKAPRTTESGGTSAKRSRKRRLDEENGDRKNSREHPNRILTEADSFLQAISDELSIPISQPPQDDPTHLRPKRSRDVRRQEKSSKIPRDVLEKEATRVDASAPKAPAYSLPLEFTSLNAPSNSAKTRFTVDLREDTFNIHHCRPDRTQVPHYRRFGGGIVLGVHPRLRISLSSAYRGDGLQLTEGGHNQAISISHPSVLALLNDKHLKRISVKTPSEDAPDQVLNNAPFIPLVETVEGPEQKRKSVSRLAINLYEDLESDDELLHYQPPHEDGGESTLDQLNRKKSEYEKRVRHEPGDVETWLGLVDLQDAMRELGLIGLRARAGEVDPEDIYRHTRGTSDLKLSYLKEALSVKSNQEDERLLLAYMKAYCDQPDVDPTQEWRKVLSAHPSLTMLWIAYINWKQAESGRMNVNELVEDYEELIDRLIRRTEAPSVSDKQRCEYEQNIIYLFHRCCVMLRQAGYNERATACFQAIVEINFLGSGSPSYSLNEIIEDFEHFWDSEAPRIGEDGAQGWEKSRISNGSALFPSKNFHNVITARPEDWLDQWQSTELVLGMPLRTTDTENEVDPFGCVLFDDIRNMCFLVSSLDSRQALLYSFFSFVGFAVPPPDVATNVPFFTDPFLSTELLDDFTRQTNTFWPELEKRCVMGDHGVPEKLSGIRSPLGIPFRVFPSDLRQFFSPSSDWFVRFDPRPDQQTFIRNTFMVLKNSPVLRNETYFKLCELSFEARSDPASASQLARQYLAQDQSNWILWDAYARICLMRRKIKQARDVYLKTLELIDEGTEGLISIWHSWAEIEFRLGNSNLVIGILARAMKCTDVVPSELVHEINKPQPAAIILRTRRALMGRLSESFNQNVPNEVLRTRVSASVSYALFEYVTVGFEAACEAFEGSLKAIQALESPVEEEELWVEYSRLIYEQTERHRSHQPVKIRSILNRAIERFPNNSIFLGLFAFNESKMKIDNETRRLIETILLKKNDVVTANSWLYAIWVEMHLNVSGFNQSAVRNLFERALRHEKTKSCLQIWILYIEFEIRNNQLERTKSLITRSHAVCPWAKELYLLPFSNRLKRVYGGRGRVEQKRMIQLCDEKSIRIKERKVLEEIERLDEIERKKDDDDDDDDDDDMLEKEALEERMRLLPY